MTKHPVTVRIVVDEMEIARRIGFSSTKEYDPDSAESRESFWQAVKTEAWRMYKAGEVNYETIFEYIPGFMHNEEAREAWWATERARLEQEKE